VPTPSPMAASCSGARRRQMCHQPSYGATERVWPLPFRPTSRELLENAAAKAPPKRTNKQVWNFGNIYAQHIVKFSVEQDRSSNRNVTNDDAAAPAAPNQVQRGGAPL
jgi:hypothetical protein